MDPKKHGKEVREKYNFILSIYWATNLSLAFYMHTLSLWILLITLWNCYIISSKLRHRRIKWLPLGLTASMQQSQDANPGVSGFIICVSATTPSVFLLPSMLPPPVRSLLQNHPLHQNYSKPAFGWGGRSCRLSSPTQVRSTSLGMGYYRGALAFKQNKGNPKPLGDVHNIIHHIR